MLRDRGGGMTGQTQASGSEGPLRCPVVFVADNKKLASNEFRPVLDVIEDGE